MGSLTILQNCIESGLVNAEIWRVGVGDQITPLPLSQKKTTLKNNATLLGCNKFH